MLFILITLAPDPSTLLGVTYVNEGHGHARGLELEAQMRVKGGVRGVMSYALQHATDHDNEPLTNSPRHMLKARVSVAGPVDQSFISVEALHLGSRTTLAGHRLPSTTLATVTMIQPIGRVLRALRHRPQCSTSSMRTRHPTPISRTPSRRTAERFASACAGNSGRNSVRGDPRRD
jgi:hypothetical protein